MGFCGKRWVIVENRGTGLFAGIYRYTLSGIISVFLVNLYLMGYKTIEQINGQFIGYKKKRETGA